MLVYLLEQSGWTPVIYHQFNVLNVSRPVCILHVNNRKKQGRPLHAKKPEVNTNKITSSLEHVW